MRAFEKIQNKHNRDAGKKPYFDLTMVAVVVLLVAFGFVMIYSASAYQAGMSANFNNDSMYFLKKQIAAAIIGFIVMGVLVFIPPKFYRMVPSWVYLALAFILMALLLVPQFAKSSHGATRWLKLGPLPQFEPVEVVKLLMIIFYSRVYTKRGRDLTTFWKITLPLIPVGILGLFIRFTSHNLSSALIVMVIPLMMVSIIAKDRKSILFGWLGIAAAAAAAVGGIILIDKITGGVGNFRFGRVLAWLSPEKYSSNEGFQVMQALYAIGSGGLFGKGLGESVVKIGSISEAQNDMIFSIICEELGIFGAVCIIVLFAILIYRLFIIAANTRDLFNALLVIGIMCHISVQVILNIAVVTNSVPNTGVSLPFISAGGTSVLLFLVEIGIALSVGRNIMIEKK